MLLEARERLERLGSLRLLAETQYWIGGVHESAGRVAESREAFEKGRAVAFDVGDRKWEGVCAYGIGKLLSLAGDYAGAIEQEFDALRLLERAGSRIDIAKVCAGLGGNLLEVRRMEEAETYLRRAAAEARAVGATGTLTSALYNLASLKTITHRIPEAVEFFEEAMQLYEEQERYDRAAWCAAWLAHCHWVLGSDRRAEELWHQAQRFLSKSPEPALRVRAMRRMASAAIEAGKANIGREVLHGARAEAQAARLAGMLSEVDADLGRMTELASSPRRGEADPSKVHRAS
jgi:tetratricopeptide (TPR) repeat protein